MRRCVWSRNHKKEEALARSAKRGKKKQITYSPTTRPAGSDLHRITLVTLYGYPHGHKTLPTDAIHTGPEHSTRVTTDNTSTGVLCVPHCTDTQPTEFVTPAVWRCLDHCLPNFLFPHWGTTITVFHMTKNPQRIEPCTGQRNFTVLTEINRHMCLYIFRWSVWNCAALHSKRFLTCLCICVCVCMCVCVCVCIYIYVYVYVCIRVCVCVCIYIYICVCVYICVSIYIYIYRICSCNLRTLSYFGRWKIGVRKICGFFFFCGSLDLGFILV